MGCIKFGAQAIFGREEAMHCQTISMEVADFTTSGNLTSLLEQTPIWINVL
jgi:hypothetical protein